MTYYLYGTKLGRSHDPVTRIPKEWQEQQFTYEVLLLIKVKVDSDKELNKLEASVGKHLDPLHVMSVMNTKEIFDFRNFDYETSIMEYLTESGFEPKKEEIPAELIRKMKRISVIHADLIEAVDNMKAGKRYNYGVLHREFPYDRKAFIYPSKVDKMDKDDILMKYVKKNDEAGPSDDDEKDDPDYAP